MVFRHLQWREQFMLDDDDINSSFDRIAEKIKNLKDENENLKKSLEKERENNKVRQSEKDHLHLEELSKEMEKIFVMFEATQSYFSSLGASITEIKKKLDDLDQSSDVQEHNDEDIENDENPSIDEYHSLAQKSHETMVQKELSEPTAEEERELLLKKELMRESESLKGKDDDFFSVDDEPPKKDDKSDRSSGTPQWLDADDGADPFAENEGMDTDEFMKNFNP